jgi:uncharacterized membrane-anchored protein
MKFPPDHPLRIRLHNEVHSRPPEAIITPSRISYLALFSPPARRDEELAAVSELARRFDRKPPSANSIHYSEDLGTFRLKWERHTEFSRYTFIVSGIDPADPFANAPVDAVPSDWLAALPGQIVAAMNVALVRADAATGPGEIASDWFRGDWLVGSSLGGGVARVFTDFRIQSNGFSRWLLQDNAMPPRQAGRMVQRLLEIETYRIMALLALPIAQQAAPVQTQHERELAEITQILAGSSDTDEQALLERLTQLEAKIESRGSESYFRFSAADAYYDLVQTRIADLREERIDGLQTIQAFIERRLEPAVNTCRSIAARLEALSDRVARVTQLLSTRVDVARERQNQQVLASMDRRAGVQLRLQSTVEALSVAAMTYYAVGLVGYAARALRSVGVAVDVELAMGVSIPIIALLAAYGIYRIRKAISRRAPA